MGGKILVLFLINCKTAILCKTVIECKNFCPHDWDKGKTGKSFTAWFRRKKPIKWNLFYDSSMPEPYSDTFYIGYYKMKLCLKKPLVNMYITNI